MKIKVSKDKKILAISVLVLVFIGVSYAMTNAQAYMESTFVTGSLLELIPEECRVLETSKGVLAEVEFQRDKSGKIMNKTDINLLAANVTAGSFAEYRLTIQNISELTVTVDEWRLEIDKENNSLADYISFSGIVTVKHHDGEYTDILGSFENVTLARLSSALTSVMQYRKIERDDKIVLDIKLQFVDEIEPFRRNPGLSYELIPVFIQYFPENNDLAQESEKP